MIANAKPAALLDLEPKAPSTGKSRSRKNPAKAAQPAAGDGKVVPLKRAVASKKTTATLRKDKPEPGLTVQAAPDATPRALVSGVTSEVQDIGIRSVDAAGLDAPSLQLLRSLDAHLPKRDSAALELVLMFSKHSAVEAFADSGWGRQLQARFGTCARLVMVPTIGSAVINRDKLISVVQGGTAFQIEPDSGFARAMSAMPSAVAMVLGQRIFFHFAPQGQDGQQERAAHELAARAAFEQAEAAHFQVTFIKPLGLLMYLDMRQNLDKQYAAGQVDKDDIEFLAEHMRHADWFIDVGTNQGCYSCYFLKTFPDLKVLCVEPDDYNLKKLRRNFELNQLNSPRIHVFQGGASAREEKLQLMLNTAGNRAGSSMVVDQRKWTHKAENTELSIHCRPLLAIMQGAGVAGRVCMKIDIEGMEYDVLKAFFETAPPAIWPVAVIAESFGHVIKLVGGSTVELLIRAGYSLVNHSEAELLLPVESALSPPD